MMFRGATIMALLVALGPSAIAGEDKGAVILVDSARPRGASSRRIALLVGVEHFDDPGWPALRFTDDDAREFAARLEVEGRFESRVLIGAGKTKLEDFLDAFRSLEKERLAPEDTVLVYVSTHGTLQTRVDGKFEQVLVFEDTSRENPQHNGLVLRELLGRFDALASRRKVLILATCYSGTGKSALSDAMSRNLEGMKGAFAPPLYEVSSASVVLSASAWGETAREHPDLGHDIYTHFLIAALHGFDPNGDGATSLTEAHDFARRETYRFTQGQQRPTAMMAIEGEDPIVLAGRRTTDGSPTLASYDPSVEGLEVVVDGEMKGALPGGFVVAPGWHEIRLRRTGSNDTVAEQMVRVDSGERLDLARLYSEEAPTQLEVRVGAGVRPGSQYGSSVVPVVAFDALFRKKAWFLRGVDVSIAASFARGEDTLVLNQAHMPLVLWECEARAGLGTALVFDPFVLHLDGFVGGGYASRDVDSTFYTTPNAGAFVSLGASTVLRVRLSRIFSIGLGALGRTQFGEAPGLGGNAWLVVGIGM